MADKLAVMVIDDEEIVRKRLKSSLEKEGYDVETFSDGRYAIERMAKKKFDIIVTDVRMDDVDGLEVLEHVVSSAPESKVIIITGYATVELAREALVKGAMDFIAKPFKPSDLRAVIEKASEEIKKK